MNAELILKLLEIFGPIGAKAIQNVVDKGAPAPTTDDEMVATMRTHGQALVNKIELEEAATRAKVALEAAGVTFN